MSHEEAEDFCQILDKQVEDELDQSDETPDMLETRILRKEAQLERDMKELVALKAKQLFLKMTDSISLKAKQLLREFVSQSMTSTV